jgi:hypothetical protein
MAKGGSTLGANQQPELVEVTRSFSEPIGAAETINKYVGRLIAEMARVAAERPWRSSHRPHCRDCGRHPPDNPGRHGKARSEYHLANETV